MFKKTCFEIFAEHLGVPVIDTTNKPILATFREIMEIIKIDAF